MQELLDNIILFLAQKYLWIIIITFIIILALIGYLKDEKDRKNGISKIEKNDEEVDIHDLAMNVGNKTLTNAVNDASKKDVTSNNSFDNQSSYLNNQNDINSLNNINGN